MILTATPLSETAFGPFGQVIEAGGRDPRIINDGTCRRFHDLARLELAAAGGRPCLSIFRAEPRSLPLQLRMLERHPLSSQAFMPLNAARFLVVVAPAGESVSAGQVRAFLCAGRQGVNYGRGVWHHPLIALDAEADFLVLDRAGPGDNCDEHRFAADQTISVVV